MSVAESTPITAEPAARLRRLAFVRPGLYGRVFCVNAAVLLVAFLLLALSPVTVSSPILPGQLLVLLAGLVVMLVANALLLRISLHPLERLRELMQTVDLLEPGRRLELDGPPEVAAVIEAFNAALERLEDERRSSAVRVLSAQEAERHRIARELHDQIGQNLTAVVLELKRAGDGGEPDPDAIRDARELARESLEELRRISHELRPAALDDLGLASALEALCTGFARRTGLEVGLRVAGDLPVLGRPAELAVYRVVQEALTNAARHARCRSVGVELAVAGAAAELTIADDGQGLGGSVTGGGIRGMRERALSAGAGFAVAGVPGARGTVVTMRLPLDGGT